MAAGAGDAWAKDLAARLGAVPGPVWVAVHHEPENDSGDLQDWKRMQQRLSPIFRAYPNVGFTVILMGYHQFGAPTIDPKKSIDALYPGTQHVDVMGFDIYNGYGTVKSSGETNTNFLELKLYYAKIATWAKSVGGVNWALGESGFTDLAAQKDVAWLSRSYDDMKIYGGIAFTYWDDQVEEKPANTFRLDSTLKQKEFAKVLARSNRLGDTALAAPATAPPAPTGLAVTSLTSTTVGLSWSASTGATSYQVLRNGVQVGTTTVPSFSNGGLTAATTYSFAVRAVNAAGSSPASVALSVTTKSVSAVAPSFRAAAVRYGNSLNAAVTLPAQVQAGDRMMLFLSTNTGVAPTATASGWVKVGERAGVDNLRTVAWTRVAASGDAGRALSIPLPRQSKFDVTVVAYSGASVAVPPAVVSAAETVTRASHWTPPASVPTTPSTVLSYWVDKSSASTGWTTPTGQIRRTSNAGTGSGRLTSIAVDPGSAAASGPWGSISATASAASAKATMWTVVLTAG
jgi:hypothetical protein